MERTVQPKPVRQRCAALTHKGQHRTLELHVLRFRKALQFKDRAHLAYCLPATVEALPVQENKNPQDVAEQCTTGLRKVCKEDKKMLKDKRKVLKGVQEERRKFMKLMDKMKGHAATAEEVQLALQQFTQLENTLQKLLMGDSPNPGSPACMEDSSSSSSSSESDDDMKMTMTLPRLEQVTTTQTTVAVDAAPKQMQAAAPVLPEDMLPSLEGLPSTPSQSFNAPGRVLVCQGKKCTAAGSHALLAQASRLASSSAVEVLPCKCLGKCKLAPAMRIKVGEGRSVLHTNVAVEAVHDMLQAAFVIDSDFEAQPVMPVPTEVPAEADRQLVCI